MYIPVELDGMYAYDDDRLWPLWFKNWTRLCSRATFVQRPLFSWVLFEVASLILQWTGMRLHNLKVRYYALYITVTD